MAPGDNAVIVLDEGLAGQYEVLTQVNALPEGGRQYLGTKGRCRFCGEAGPKSFKKVAHTFPEFVGNKKVISLDECDQCNGIFSAYESALAEFFRPHLTLGGVEGKGNKIPQTGRSVGSSIIRRVKGQPSRISLFVSGKDPQDHLTIDPVSRKLKISMPVPVARFIPRHAYKAICKMGVAILPEDELDKYAKLRHWLCDPDDQEDFTRLEVVISYAQVASPLALVHGVLLRRVSPKDEVPYILFLLVAGALCVLVDLMSDHMEDHIPPQLPSWIRINWKAVIGDEHGTDPIAVEYRGHHLEDWSSRELQERPLKQVDFNIQL